MVELVWTDLCWFEGFELCLLMRRKKKSSVDMVFWVLFWVFMGYCDLGFLVEFDLIIWFAN